MNNQDLDALSKTELIAMLLDQEKNNDEQALASHLANLVSRLGMAFAIVLIPFRYRWILLSRPFPPIYKDYTDYLLFASDVAVVVALGSWLVSLALKPRRLDFGPKFLTVSLASIVLISMGSAAFSYDPPLSVYHAVRLVFYFAIYLYVLNEIKDLRWVYLPVGIGVFIQSTVGIAQVILQRSLGMGRLGELPLDAAWRGVSIVWAEGVRSLRAYGLSDHPNILGGCLAFGLLLLAALYLSYIDPKGERPAKRSQPPMIASSTAGRARAVAMPAIAAIFALGCAGLLLTFSRSAWLALLAGLVLILLALIKNRQMTSTRSLLSLCVAGGIVMAPLVLANLPYLGVRLNAGGAASQVGNEFRSVNERKMLNASANEIFTRHAISGVGIGAYPKALREFQPEFLIDYQPAHFALLAVAADIGLFGALSYTIAVLAPWVAMGWLYIHTGRRSIPLRLAAASALLLALLVVGMFDYYTWLLAPGRFWQWLGWGLWAAAYLEYHRGGQRV